MATATVTVQCPLLVTRRPLGYIAIQQSNDVSVDVLLIGTTKQLKEVVLQLVSVLKEEEYIKEARITREALAAYNLAETEGVETK